MEQRNRFERARAEAAQLRAQLNAVKARHRNMAGQRPAARRSPFASTAKKRGTSHGVRVLGYASGSGRGGAASRELRRQAEVIARDCKRRRLHLLEMVSEREPSNCKGLGRPGLAYVLDRIATHEADGLVVAELSRLTPSVAELGTIIELLARSKARLVAAAHGLDTQCEAGRLAANLLIEVSRWDRRRLSERTRDGLQAARRGGRPTGRPAVTDDPELTKRITRMRAQGMTLQAIADQLNRDGVPTVRGGAEWRHSSVQAAAGYRRGRRPLPP